MAAPQGGAWLESIMAALVGTEEQGRRFLRACLEPHLSLVLEKALDASGRARGDVESAVGRGAVQRVIAHGGGRTTWAEIVEWALACGCVPSLTLRPVASFREAALAIARGEEV